MSWFNGPSTAIDLDVRSVSSAFLSKQLKHNVSKVETALISLQHILGIIKVTVLLQLNLVGG